MRWVAYFYMNGIAVEKDKEEAVNWLRTDAKFGDVEATEALEQMDL